MSSPPSLNPLTLIIRFSSSLPDLPLTIPHPQTTTSTTLSTLIRPHLPPLLQACPLRLIHAGALLPLQTPLDKSLRLSPTGKSPSKFYIHCSIATESRLSPSELEAEARAASRLQTLQLQNTSQGQGDDDDDRGGTVQRLVSPTAAPPQGFDRLLSAGLSPTEIASLRSQFLAIEAHTHTPDTMPTPTELRLLEERWLDSGQPLAGTGGSGPGDEDGGVGGLEDMLWGNVMGFFWAIGAILWLVREEGVWSRRRQVGVVTGVLVNVAFCVMRVGG